MKWNKEEILYELGFYVFCVQFISVGIAVTFWYILKWIYNGIISSKSNIIYLLSCISSVIIAEFYELIGLGLFLFSTLCFIIYMAYIDGKKS